MKSSEKIEILGSCQKVEKKLWNMKLIMIPIAFGVLEVVKKSLEKDSRNRKYKEKLRP